MPVTLAYDLLGTAERRDRQVALQPSSPTWRRSDGGRATGRAGIESHRLASGLHLCARRRAARLARGRSNKHRVELVPYGPTGIGRLVPPDPTGAITAYTYGPYGEPQSWAGSRFRYTGQMAIPEAQLYHYRARVYDPMMGRFLQTDPARYSDGPNIYAYTHGDPVNGSDPSGLGYQNDNGGQVQCNDDGMLYGCRRVQRVVRGFWMAQRPSGVAGNLDTARAFPLETQPRSNTMIPMRSTPQTRQERQTTWPLACLRTGRPRLGQLPIRPTIPQISQST